MLTVLAAQTINGLQVTVIGLTVVFGVLSFLWAVLSILNALFIEEEPTGAEPSATSGAPAARRKAKKETEPQQPRVVSPAEKKPSPTPTHKRIPIDERTPAVIAAAVSQTVNFTPDQITVRRCGRGYNERLATVLGAIFSSMEDIPEHIRIQRVEGRSK